MCQACGKPEHQAPGFMEFSPRGSEKVVAKSVEDLIRYGIGVSPIAVMMAFGSEEAAKDYVESQNLQFHPSMLQ